MAAKKKKITLRSKQATDEDDKAKKLGTVIAQINKALGQSGAVFLGSQQREFERISTGIVALDYVLGGGVVRGQLVQFTGADSSFKTSAAMMCAAKVQEQGGLCVWVAGEGFDKKWANKLGVELDNIHIITADTGDTALEAAMTMIETNLIDLVVLDSIQSLGTTREMEGSIEDEAFANAGAGQMWGRMMRKVYAAMNAGARAALIGISQVRAPIGKFSPRGQPEPEGTGIRAIMHWKSADVYFRKGEMDFEGDASEKRRLKGREFKVRCIKNKTAESERQASFELSYENKHPFIDNTGTLFRLARAHGLITVKGAWYIGYGIRAQGEDKYLEALQEDDEALEVMQCDLIDLLQ